eukprot:gene1199-10713_t
MSDLSGKVALVTGSTDGIGLGIAKVLASKGCHVVVNGRRAEKEVEKMLKSFEEYKKSKVIYCQGDLIKGEDCKNLVKFTIEKLGKIDILVNNAGIQHVSPIEQFSDDNWDRVIALNLTACFHTMKEALSHWKSKEDKNIYGRIVNISSVHGVVGSVNKSAYVAAKHGLNGLTKVCALENAEYNITCNSVCPGWVHTTLVQNQIELIAKEKGISEEEAKILLVSAKQPSKRFTTCEQVGEMNK